MKIDREIFELYKQTNELRNQIIQNIDNQVVQVRQIFCTFMTALLGTTVFTNRKELGFVGIIISLAFWYIETSIKKNQRGYILTSNELQKSIAKSDSEEELCKVIVKFHSDLNGYYSIKRENIKKYKKQTSLIHTMFMRNVCVLYIFMIIISIIFILYKWN